MEKAQAGELAPWFILIFLEIIELVLEYQVERGKRAIFQELFLDCNQRLAGKRSSQGA